MAFLIIESDNKDLSYVLVKNPDSGMAAKMLRDGVVYGWFNNESYHMYFDDDPASDSFNSNEFSYLGMSRFVSPVVYQQMISKLLHSAVMAHEASSEYDIESKNKIVLETVECKSKSMLGHLKKHLPVNVDYDYNEFIDAYKITFSHDKITLSELLNTTILSCLLMSGEDGVQMTQINDSFLLKYIGIINKLELPYFFRYLFSRNYLGNKQMFEKYGHLLETDNIKLSRGDTSFQRLRSIEKMLEHQYPLLDVGCGEGMYALNLSKKSPFKYTAVDINEDLISILAKKAKSRDLDIDVSNSIDNVNRNNVYDILLVEVIEHMDINEAKKLVTDIRDTIDFNNMFITTPNKAFNVNYLLNENEYRHDDHSFEFNSSEFDQFISEIFDSNLFDLEIIDIGDTVNGVATTQGYKVTKKEHGNMAIVTVGCSASGKSTLADKITNNGSMSSEWVEINRDNIRFNGKNKDWSTYKFSKKNESFVTKKWYNKLNNAISNNKNIIISDTNINKDNLDKVVNSLKDEGYYVEIKYFDVPFETLLKRDNNRSGGVGYEVLLNQYIRYQRTYNNIKVYEPLNDKKLTYIFDIDGTLADHTDVRSPYDMHLVDKDKKISHVVEVAESLFMEGYTIIFLSGRSESSYDLTRKWLNDNLGDWVEDCSVFMRTDNDSRKDYIVKMELFDKYVRYNYDVLGVFDDRKQVIESCWNVLGVNVFNVGNPTVRF